MVVQGGNLVSCAMDNTVRVTPLATRQYGMSIGLDSPVAGVAVGKRNADLVVAATMGSVVVLRGGRIASTLPIKFVGTCVALSPDEREVVVGGKDDKAIHVYELAGDTLKEKQVITQNLRGALVALAYSPDGKHLASTDVSRNIFVWDAATKALKIEGWIFHTARVSSLAWTPDSMHIASGGLDSSLYVWSVAQPDKRIFVKNAHPSGVNVVAWLAPSILVSVG
jgi:DNA-binding beta-propeller fold protein YncE